MNFYRDLFDSKISKTACGSYVTIGTFDGVHKGHQKLISTVAEEGAKNHCTSVVITFDPLPKLFLGKGQPESMRLTSPRTRAERIALLGADMLIQYTFDESFSKLTAEDFIRRILVHLNPKKIFIGKDFKFGYKGAGDLAFLQQAGTKFGFDIEALPFINLDQDRISSTRVRNAIRRGDVKLAAELMGKHHEVTGRVMRMMSGAKVYFVPHSDVILPPAGDYQVGIDSDYGEHYTLARVLESNKFIEVFVNNQIPPDFFSDNVALRFVDSTIAIRAGETKIHWG